MCILLLTGLLLASKLIPTVSRSTEASTADRSQLLVNTNKNHYQQIDKRKPIIIDRLDMFIACFIFSFYRSNRIYKNLN